MSRNETFSVAAIRECIDAAAIDNPELAAQASAELARLGADEKPELMPYQVLELGYGTRTRFAFHATSDADAWDKSQGYRGIGMLLIKEVEAR
jgi:hypothetical protein